MNHQNLIVIVNGNDMVRTSERLIFVAWTRLYSTVFTAVAVM